MRAAFINVALVSSGMLSGFTTAGFYAAAAIATSSGRSVPWAISSLGRWGVALSILVAVVAFVALVSPGICLKERRPGLRPVLSTVTLGVCSALALGTGFWIFWAVFGPPWSNDDSSIPMWARVVVSVDLLLLDALSSILLLKYLGLSRAVVMK